MTTPLIIMPIKDSLQTAERAIRAITASGFLPMLYDDNSLPENARRLDELADELSLPIVHLSDITDHPSPNYLLVLQRSQQQAIAEQRGLLIIESDVIVKTDTIQRLMQGVTDKTGMVAAVTTDEQGQINYPYEYARGLQSGDTRKHLSFCCTLLTLPFLQAFSFQQLSPEKDWFDVTISHKSTELGFRNLLLTDTPVVHLPHSSRPWKQLKYTHPLRYYWNKLTHGKDRI